MNNFEIFIIFYSKSGSIHDSLLMNHGSDRIATRHSIHSTNIKPRILHCKQNAKQRYLYNTIMHCKIYIMYNIIKFVP